MTHAFSLMPVGALAILAGGTLARVEEPFRDDFRGGGLDGWRAREGRSDIRRDLDVADGGFSLLVREGCHPRDVEVAADVGSSHAAAGIAFRLGTDSTRYLLGLREIASHGSTGTRRQPWISRWGRSRPRRHSGPPPDVLARPA